jgi:Protein of unknown function (DUF3761)
MDHSFPLPPAPRDMHMQNAPMIRLWLSLLVGMSLLATAPLQAQEGATATVTCKDGSSSHAGKGACSHHGGVNKDVAASTSATSGAAASTLTPAAAAKAAPTTAAPPASTGSSTVAGSTGMKPAASSAANVRNPTAKCKDGTMSYSKTHSGSCSHHGGVAEFLDK